MPPPMVQPTPDPPDVMNLPLAVVVSQFPPLFHYRVFESDGSLHLEVEFNEEPTVKDMIVFLNRFNDMPNIYLRAADRRMYWVSHTDMSRPLPSADLGRRKDHRAVYGCDLWMMKVASHNSPWFKKAFLFTCQACNLPRRLIKHEPGTIRSNPGTALPSYSVCRLCKVVSDRKALKGIGSVQLSAQQITDLDSTFLEAWNSTPFQEPVRFLEYDRSESDTEDSHFVFKLKHNLFTL